jgi:hypothetical protein
LPTTTRVFGDLAAPVPRSTALIQLLTAEAQGHHGNRGATAPHSPVRVCRQGLRPIGYPEPPDN